MRNADDGARETSVASLDHKWVLRRCSATNAEFLPDELAVKILQVFNQIFVSVRELKQPKTLRFGFAHYATVMFFRLAERGAKLTTCANAPSRADAVDVMQRQFINLRTNDDEFDFVAWRKPTVYTRHCVT